MFENYTDQAVECLMFAHLEAEWLGNRQVEVEHLLLALAFQEVTLAANLLKEYGENIHVFGVEANQSAEAFASGPDNKQPQLSQDVLEILKRAQQNALRRKCLWVTTEEILAALLESNHATIEKLVAIFGISVPRLKSEVEQNLAEKAATQNPHWTLNERISSLQRGILAWETRAEKSKIAGLNDQMAKANLLKTKWLEELLKLQAKNSNA